MAKKFVHLALYAAMGSVPCWALPTACRVGGYWKDLRIWRVNAYL